jgi:S-adenosylmethionine hydrolase
MTRPVIGFLTDFGADSAAAICRAVILSIANDAQVVDISHSVRKFAIGDGAYLLRAALPWFPVGVHLAVVDPGVGTQRLPIAIRVGRGDILVGPDNGLLPPAADRLGGIVEARILENPELMLAGTSSTFHGRDVFAPVAAHLALGAPFGSVGSLIAADRLVTLDTPRTLVGDGRLETAVVYVDSFGNIRLGATPDELAAAVGTLESGRRLELEFGSGRVERAPWARTFGEIPRGGALVYADSSGDVAFADNQGDAASRLGVVSGERVVIRAR